MNIVAFTFVLVAITQFPVGSKNSIVPQRNNFPRINTNDLHEFSLIPNSFSEPSTIDTEQSIIKIDKSENLETYRVTIDDTLNLPQQFDSIIQKPTGKDLSPTLSPEEIIDLSSTLLLEGEGVSRVKDKKLSDTNNGKSSIAERYAARKEAEKAKKAAEKEATQAYNSENYDEETSTSISTPTNPGKRVKK